MLSDECISRIDTLCRIAEFNESRLSVEELSLLLKAESTPAELEGEFANPPLSSKYRVNSGIILGTRQSYDPEAVSNRRTKSAENLARAVKVLPLIGGKVIAVSGSTSYRSARHSDDLDFFVVTKTGGMWISLAKSLVFLRLHKRLSSAPPVCLSCSMDYDYAKRLFTRPQDALFARDALSAVVLEGEGDYSSFLNRAAWISELFPRLYALRARPSEDAVESHPSTPWSRALNLFLFRVVGSYVQLKAYMANRRFIRAGAMGRKFSVLLGPDHCIYESERYKSMRAEYAAFYPAKADSSASRA